MLVLVLIARHLIKDFLRVLEPLDQLAVVTLHDFVEPVLAPLLGFAGVDHLLLGRTDQDLTLVDE